MLEAAEAKEEEEKEAAAAEAEDDDDDAMAEDEDVVREANGLLEYSSARSSCQFQHPYQACKSTGREQG